ncbi:hypothetical protein Tco_0976840 [Tanacetum coccineum]|uniref:Uncharacterized protein n=1 Tax=Tanacetum coccineum TaxID=301880 RepID=A0ABQ5EIE9_9ASTR
MSTAEAEYVSLSACYAQVIWMRTQLLDYGYKYNRIPMYCDSKSEHVEKGTVELYFVGTEYQLANLFTKAHPKERFEYLVHRIVIIMAQQQYATDVHPDELCPLNKRYDLMDANKKEYGSKYRLTFMLDKKMLSLTLDDIRTIFHLPQATDNNHDSFVQPPSFLDMVPFYKNELGFTMELNTSSCFKTTGLLQPWQTLCKIFSKCLTTRVTGWDLPPLQIMQMMYCFINNIHVDYEELLWEGLHYSLHHLTSLIPYARFTKIIISHYMTNFSEISRHARDTYHNLKDDDIMKNIFNSGRHKDKVGMKISDWMISEEMNHIENYQMYAEVFGIDVPLTQSQPTESTQGRHRTPSAPRSPNPKVDAGVSSTLKRSTMIRFCIPQRRSTCLTPPAPVPTVDKVDEMILQDTLQVSLVDKSREEQEARENVELVNKHLASEEIEKMVDEPKMLLMIVQSLRMMIKIFPALEEEITDEVYELKRMEKGKIVEESRSTPSPTPIRSPRILIDAKPTRFKCYKSFFQELQGCYGYLFKHMKAKFLSRKSFDTLVDHLQEVMVESLPTMVDKYIKEQVEKQVPKQVKVQVPVYVVKGMLLERQQNKEETDKMIAKAMLQEHGRLQAKISSQIQQAIDNNIPFLVDAFIINYMSGHILHVHPAQPQTRSIPEQQYQLYLSMKNNPQLKQQDIAIWLALQMKFETLQVPQTTCRTSAVRPRDQDDPHDDAPPEGENSPKRQKISEYKAYVTGESFGQVNESEQSPSYSDDDETPTKQVSQDIIEEVSLTINKAELKKIADEMLRQKYLLYLKKGNSRPEKILLSLHKFPAIIFNDVDIEEQTSRWNPHAKIFYIKRQKEPGKPKEIVGRRANECLVSITESDYKNLNKNDIEDMYLLIMNGKVPDYVEIGIEEHKMFSIIYEPVHGIIYKNSKKEKRVMRHSEIHKFCDATLNRVLEGLKSYNNDVKYRYIETDLTEDEKMLRAKSSWQGSDFSNKWCSSRSCVDIDEEVVEKEENIDDEEEQEEGLAEEEDENDFERDANELPH